jgi:chaperonin GroEL (HSP60 family)
MNGIDTIADVTRRVGGDEAVQSNLAAGVALSEMLRSTLGPNGRDKMLVGDGTVVLTNDGARVVDLMDLESPAATLVAGVARAQNGELGDGSTAAVVLAGALLSEAESLLDDGFHPTTIIEGYAEASTRARATLDDLASTPDSDDDATLRDVVATAITGRWDDERTAFLADLAARA